MMLYKNTKVEVRSPDEDTDNFDIVTGVPQGNTLAPHLLIIYQEYMLRMSKNLMKEKFQAGKGKKQKIPRKNYYGHGLRRWCTSIKYTHPNRIPAT